MEKYKNVIQNRKLKTSARPWSEELQLPDGSYSVSDTQDYFDYIIKKYEAVPDNLSITMYINKVEKRNTFKIKTGYYLEILTPTTMKVLGNLEALKVIQIRKKIVENVPSLEITQVVLVHCNTVNNVYQHDPRDLSTFLPNKSLAQLLDISPKKIYF